jgi:hypothetical protein
MSTPTTAESFNTLRGMFGGLLRPPNRKPSPTQSEAQQAVLNRLRSGGTIQGAQPNNPLAYAAQFFDPRRLLEGKPPTSSIPTLRGGMVGGREALIAPGGWNKDTAGLGEITVGGQRFFPAQAGKDLVYQRAPGQIGGQYGSIRVPDQLASSVETPSNPEERAYQQEKARVTQMTEQDPMFKKYKVAELTKAYNTASPEEKNKIGLQIWATTNPELAAKLKPGQTGYQEAYDLLGTQTFGTGQPVSTKVNFEQSTEKAGAPTPELPTGFAQAYTNPVPNFGMGINMQQTAYAPEGQSAPEMVSPDFSNIPLMSPPKELVDLMKNRAFKQAFESRIK